MIGKDPGRVSIWLCLRERVFDMSALTKVATGESDPIVIAGGLRTPFGKLTGALSPLSAADLGGYVIRGALANSQIGPELVDYVILGHVIGAGAGQMPARQAAHKGGISLDVASVSINKACLSGLNAIYMAWKMIQCGDAEIVVAGGMESMTNAPHVLPGVRSGWKLGERSALDTVNHDALFCAIDHELMGTATQRYADAKNISRERQDELACLSHERAVLAARSGRFKDEIIPVEIPQRRGEPVVVSDDEGVRADTTVEKLAKLSPVFSSDGTITAGNASQISDGASATVIMRASKAKELGIEPLCELVSYGQVAGPDTSLLTQPSQAALKAISASGSLTLDDIALFEINEAFAAVTAASIDDLGIGMDRVNLYGGAVAIGHPVGATGNRIALSLAHQLKARGGGFGVAALCGGGGQGDALIIKV